MKTRVQEIFSSIQGEGIYVGVRQIFIRFVGCNLHCAYCDTQETLAQNQELFRVETEQGKGLFSFYPNPVSPEELYRIIINLKPEIHHSLSLTGGEPLMQEEFLLEFLPLFCHQYPIFLETNGTLTEPLIKLLPHLDIISMDIKQPSATGHTLWQQHEEFLRIARNKSVYVKTVLTGDTTDEELEKIIGIIAKVDKSIPLVLQPVTPYGVVKEIAAEKIIGIQDYCSITLKNVRVIPQTHKIINQL